MVETLVRRMELQFRVVVTVSALFSTFIIGPLAYMLADNQLPYEYDVDASYVIPDVTPSGRQMTVHWKLKKVNRVCRGAITRTIVDRDTGVKTTYDPTPAAQTIDLGDMTLDRTFYLPPLITPGRKWYYSDAEFACNLLQQFYPLRTVTPRLPFTVGP